jgi:RHS repeat-associated protein
LIYNARAQLDTIAFQTSSGSALMNDQFGYDANLRPTSTTATWQSGSGNSGTAYSQTDSYDPDSNLISLTTSLPAVPGVSGSGGSETQNFCYDEQNRLVWAGNSGTQPGAGNGTCGSGTLANSLSGASYSASYVSTHLGQLWQGPLAGGSTQEQYLYCSSSQPHQLTGLYPTGTTCSNLSGAVYTSSYDSWGNVTSRTFSGSTATLSYDLLDHLTKWFVSSTNKEQYAYDASGNRVLRRSTTSSSTTIIVYAFGLEEHQYSGSGTNQWNTYYYSLAGHLIGSLDGNGTTFYLTDALGSILTSFTNAAGGASVKGEQSFAPYGTSRYSQGTINTAKGFTGQYNDSLSGLDYYNVRYYDPVVGVFLSADTQQGNPQGMNPYAYVGGNPETRSDPTGLRAISACPTNNCDAPVDMTVVRSIINFWDSSDGTSSSTGIAKVTSASSLTNPLSSCGLAQTLCGWYGVHLALYFGPFQIGVPVVWSVESGQPGGGSRGSDETGSVTGGMLSSDTGGGAVQEGSLTIEPNDGQPYSPDELAAARYVASIYDSPDDSVILRPPTGEGQTSDLLVNGKAYDIYTPRSGSIKSIVSAILDKNSQATGIVINLFRTDVTRTDLGNLLYRMSRAMEVRGKTLNIDDIIIMDAPWWPDYMG